MKKLGKIIKIDEERCNGCGACVPSCAEGAIQIINGKAKLISDRYCDGLGVCLAQCPLGALTLIDAAVEAFDEKAVYENLKAKKASEAIHNDYAAPAQKIVIPCDCPSTIMRSLTAEAKAVISPAEKATPSALRHWPVQISLIPPAASFLQGADLLVAADCTPFAYGAFHRDLLSGKVLMAGCPKLDDIEAYRGKFTEIFEKVDIKSITVVIMEVPCCRALPMMLQQAMVEAKRHIPMKIVTVSVEGKILNR